MKTFSALFETIRPDFGQAVPDATPVLSSPVTRRQVDSYTQTRRMISQQPFTGCVSLSLIFSAGQFMHYLENPTSLGGKKKSFSYHCGG